MTQANYLYISLLGAKLPRHFIVHIAMEGNFKLPSTINLRSNSMLSTLIILKQHLQTYRPHIFDLLDVLNTLCGTTKACSLYSLVGI